MKRRSLPLRQRLVLISLLVVAGWLLAALAIFLIESNAESAMITSYPDALWYTLVTVSTVGYGDLYPVSAAGKVIGGILILVSVGFIGFIVGKFGEIALERNRNRRMGMNGTRFSGHYVIIGWSDISRTVIREVIAANFDVAVLAREERELDEIHTLFHDENRVYSTLGPYDDEEVYRRMNIEKAAGAIVLTGNDTSTLITVLQLKGLRPDLKITAYIQNTQLKKTVENAGVSYVISPTEVVGRMIASATFEPDVSKLLEDLLSTTTRQEDLDVQEFRLMPGNPLVGLTIREASHKLEDTTGAKLLSISRFENGEWHLTKHQSAALALQPDDYLIVLVDAVTAERAEEYFGVVQGRLV